MSYKIQSICLKFSLVACSVLVCLMGKSQYNFSEVDKLLTSNAKALGNDVVAVVYKDGKIIYQKELGEFTAKSKAHVASSSKWLTAALVMTFVDEGKISLDTRVSTYIPIFAQYGKSYITIRQCLSHQVGIADNQNLLGKLLDRHKFESLEEEVNSFAKREIEYNPGTSFSYGNMGLNIAGRVLEIISKKRFELLIRQRLFLPLNMKNSSFSPEDFTVDPSGGAETTAADYMNFLTMLLDNGMFNGKRILSEASVAEMQKSQIGKVPKKYVPKLAEGYEYGLGEWIEQTDASGNSMVVSSPGLFGTYPYIDKCRKYASIIFVGSLLGEQKKDLYQQFKKAVDQQIPASCP